MKEQRLKVLLVASTNPGGQWIQSVKTAESLKKLGVTVEHRVSDWNVPKGVDLVHAFSSACLPAVKVAKKRGVPVVVSPIFWPKTDYFRQFVQETFLTLWERAVIKLRHSVLGKMRLDRTFYSRGIGALAHTQIEQARECFSLADFLLPNGESEMEMVKKVSL